MSEQLVSQVNVLYIGDEDAAHHIKSVLPHQKGSKRLKSKGNGLDLLESQSSCKDPLTIKNNCARDADQGPGAAELVEDDDDSHQIYLFKTPKRRKQLAKYASASVEKRKSVTKGSIHGTKDVVKPLYVQDDESTDDDSSENESEDECPEKPVKGKPSRPSTNFGLESERELYFDVCGRKKGQSMTATSDHTLQKLKTPKMTAEQLSKVLSDFKVDEDSTPATTEVSKARAMLFESYKDHFHNWMFYFGQDFNILLYGLGSKRELIHSFCDVMLVDHDKLVVNGFFPEVSVKTILTSIVEEVMNKPESCTSNVEAMLDTICDFYGKSSSNPKKYPGEHLYLAIHNIDGAGLRNPRHQRALARLAEAPGIHVVASIDHINAPLLWEQTTALNFNWLSYDVTTYRPYADETSYEGSLLVSGAGAVPGSRGAVLALSGLMHVTCSLTSNARAVFRILVVNHLGEEEDGEGGDAAEGMPFHRLYQRCRENFLVNSELTLRAHLTEFLDHKLVQIRKGVDGGDCLTVPLDRSTLVEYLEQVDS